jgi:Family of unknown function (DUF5994)
LIGAAHDAGHQRPDHRRPPSQPPAAVAPRLRLDPTLSRRGGLDGGWWPRSRDPRRELPTLIAALDRQLGRVSRVALNLTRWDSAPRRVPVGDRMPHVGWFRTMDPDVVTVTTTGRQRFALLVVSPQAAPTAAAAALALAAAGQHSLRPADILIASGLAAREDSTHAPLRLVGALS